MENKKQTLELQNKLEELQTISIFLEELFESWNLGAASLMSINLVLEEAFTNIVNYAYEDTLAHNIIMSFEYKNSVLTIEITDDGKAYDPTSLAEPDINIPAEERKIGGLGIFLMRRIMDEVTYRYQEKKNILTLKKNIAS